MEEFYKHVGEVFSVANEAGLRAEVRDNGDRAEVIVSDGEVFAAHFVMYEMLKNAYTPDELLRAVTRMSIRKFDEFIEENE